jgi:hypothetical protein
MPTMPAERAIGSCRAYGDSCAAGGSRATPICWRLNPKVAGGLERYARAGIKPSLFRSIPNSSVLTYWTILIE